MSQGIGRTVKISTYNWNDFVSDYKYKVSPDKAKEVIDQYLALETHENIHKISEISDAVKDIKWTQVGPDHIKEILSKIKTIVDRKHPFSND